MYAASAASLRAGRAPGRLRFDVQPLARRHLVAQRHRLGDRFTGADLRVDRGAAGRSRDRGVDARFRGGRGARAAAVARIAQQLERGTVVAGRTQRDAPVGHRHVLVELERLRAGPLRFLEPERMNLRHPLQEELAGLFRLRRHRKVLGDAHARAAASPAAAAARPAARCTCPARALAPVYPWPPGQANRRSRAGRPGQHRRCLHGAKYSRGPW